MAGPDLLAFTFIGKTALTKRAIDLLAGNELDTILVQSPD